MKNKKMTLIGVLNEQWGNVFGQIKTSRNYVDDVISNLKSVLEDKFGISEKAFGALDQLWANIDNIYWKQQDEIAPFIKKFEQQGKRPEYATEMLLDSYFNEFKFEELEANFGETIELKVPGVVHYDYDWSCKCNTSAKFLGKRIGTPEETMGVNQQVFSFKMVGVNPAEIVLTEYEKSTKKICKRYVYRIYIKTGMNENKKFLLKEQFVASQCVKTSKLSQLGISQSDINWVNKKYNDIARKEGDKGTCVLGDNLMATVNGKNYVIATQYSQGSLGPEMAYNEIMKYLKPKYPKIKFWIDYGNMD